MSDTPEVQEQEVTANAVPGSGGRTPDLDKPYLWRVLKLMTNNDDGSILWLEVGSLPGEYAFFMHDYQALGELAGPGEYLLVEGAYRAEFVTIKASPQRFEKVEDES